MTDFDKGLALAARINGSYGVSGLVFVHLAQTDALDDVTVTEHSEFFPEWHTDIAYAAGMIVRYEEKLYKCNQAHTSQMNWTPPAAASLWRKIGDPAEEYPLWSQPIGAHDAYAEGDRVTHGGRKWISVTAGNVWEPGVYGWTEAVL